MGESLWLPGTVADCYVKAGHGTAQWMPYQIDLDRGDACYAQSDDPRLIRNVGGAGEDLAWNDRHAGHGGRSDRVPRHSPVKQPSCDWHVAHMQPLVFYTRLTSGHMVQVI